MGLVLISAAPAPLATAFGDALGALRAQGRLISGRDWVLDPLDKGMRFVNICRELGGVAAVALGGAFDDAPVLQAAQHATAINPMPKLRALAAAEGWPIIDCAAYDAGG